jgi:hypothetical protein
MNGTAPIAAAAGATFRETDGVGAIGVARGALAHPARTMLTAIATLSDDVRGVVYKKA